MQLLRLLLGRSRQLPRNNVPLLRRYCVHEPRGREWTVPCVLCWFTPRVVWI